MIRRVIKNPDGSCVVLTLDSRLNPTSLHFVTPSGREIPLLDPGALPLDRSDTLTPHHRRMLKQEQKREYQRVYKRIVRARRVK